MSGNDKDGGGPIRDEKAGPPQDGANRAVPAAPDKDAGPVSPPGGPGEGESTPDENPAEENAPDDNAPAGDGANDDPAQLNAPDDDSPKGDWPDDYPAPAGAPPPDPVQPPGEARTVFIPPEQIAEHPAPDSAPPEPPPPVTPAAPPAHERTVIGGIAPPGSSGSDGGDIPPSDPPRTQIALGAGGDKQGRQIKVGDVLNHIFEVRRFIARGGMGEVFEGVNVNTDERVAIKVILPHLVADAAVQAMFLKEARTLTKLNHPGLVQYRVLALEPELRALYIVTDYVDGVNMSDILGQLNAGPQDVKPLLARLAGALQTAHDLGAIHRDISPDNIMLEGSDLGRAKIIDFGIAKDLDPGGQTIVGEGFAGKLNYVAPEQLGDFNRNVGPWTDVYSLALTILAVLGGRDVDMGATLVDAVDRRRAGVDLTGVSDPELRAVLQRMLQPDPADRPASMNEVIDMLGLPAATTFTPDTAGDGAPPPASGLERAKAWAGANPLPAIGAAAALLLAIAGLAFLLPGSGEGDGDGQTTADGGPAKPVAPPDNPVEAARAAITSELGDMPCSWLDIVDMSADGTDIAMQLRGVSGKSAEALDRIETSLEGIGLNATSIDFSDVSPIQANTCRPLEAFLKIRSEGAQRLAAKQNKFEMNILPASAGADAGKLGGQAVITLDLSDMSDNVTLVGMDETGKMDQFAPSRDIIQQYGEAMGDDRYRFTLNTTHSGWSGILMLTGQAPFPETLLTSDSQTRGSDWPERFLAMAEAQGWKSEMVWYRTVDEVANRR